jgi:hypothetical protein
MTSLAATGEDRTVYPVEDRLGEHIVQPRTHSSCSRPEKKQSGKRWSRNARPKEAERQAKEAALARVAELEARLSKYER